MNVRSAHVRGSRYLPHPAARPAAGCRPREPPCRAAARCPPPTTAPHCRVVARGARLTEFSGAKTPDGNPAAHLGAGPGRRGVKCVTFRGRRTQFAPQRSAGLPPPANDEPPHAQPYLPASPGDGRLRWCGAESWCGSSTGAPLALWWRARPARRGATADAAPIEPCLTPAMASILCAPPRVRRRPHAAKPRGAPARRAVAERPCS